MKYDFGLGDCALRLPPRKDNLSRGSQSAEPQVQTPGFKFDKFFKFDYGHQATGGMLVQVLGEGRGMEVDGSVPRWRR